MHRTAVYPGTFDPLTLGHFDLLRRSAALFDRLIVVVAGVSHKATGMFDLKTRMAMIQESVAEANIPNVEVDSLDCLLVEYCCRRKIGVIVRGLRVYSDFEYEFQMALTNRKLAPAIETLFMMPNESYSYVTASTVREISRYGGDTSVFVPKSVHKHIEAYMRSHAAHVVKAGGGVASSGAFDR
ncbi:MAG: pantetheine-phosphate adenylyltransferase [Kiritimatiellae bacterium]|nr:pantetheine-phosphate adenylyltransferase [Kiritimatiellia bacterium]